MTAIVSVSPDGDLLCSECGPIAGEPGHHAGWDHLLDVHRDQLVAHHGEAAVKRAEAKR